jgi:hypothetical protein
MPPTTPPSIPPSTPPSPPDLIGPGGSGTICDGASIGAAFGFVLGRGTAFGASTAFAGCAGGGGGGGGGGAAGASATKAIIVGTLGRLLVAYSSGTITTTVRTTT